MEIFRQVNPEENDDRTVLEFLLDSIKPLTPLTMLDTDIAMALLDLARAVNETFTDEDYRNYTKIGEAMDPLLKGAVRKERAKYPWEK